MAASGRRAWVRGLATGITIALSVASPAVANGQWANTGGGAPPPMCAFSAPKVQEYYAYLAEKSCSGALTNKCLEPTSYVATRSDGRRVTVNGVYRWRESGDAHNDTWRDDHDPAGSAPRKRLLVHFLIGYLKVLRDAYATCPATFFDQAYNQIDFIVSDAALHGGALVWENRLGIAQAMEQGELAVKLMEFADLHDRHGYAGTARGTMAYALRAALPFFRPAGPHSGGVRSANQDACAAKTARLRPCFWFHSRGRGIDTTVTGEPLVNTVLNEFLHAVRDLITVSVKARALSHLIPDDPPPPHFDFRTWLTWGDLLEDRAIGGLYQLAFSAGHKAVAPTRPPNLAQFMDRHVYPVYGGWGAPWGPFYSSYYAFDLSTGQPRNISHMRTCHYHAHTLNKLAEIWNVLDRNSGSVSLEHGWRLYEAIDRLFTGRGETVGREGSTNAVYQFYRTEEPYYRYTAWRCPVQVDDFVPETLSEESRALFERFFGPW